MKINLDYIEVEIITSCNLGCFGCDRSSRQAPSAEMMTLDQISKFISQSLELNKKWELISILGGEPTLHPELLKILDLIHSAGICKVLKVITNGYGDKVKEVLKTIPSYVLIQNSNKLSPVQTHFTAYNVAPKDVGFDLNRNKCRITAMCGMGLTRYGYYLCGAGASIDRVFGLKLGIKHLKDVNEESLSKMIPPLCGLCGHAMQRLRSQKEPGNGERTSESWKNAYEKYKTSKPELELF